MKIDRKTMLATLESVRSGLSSFKELLEQSCSFVFKEGRVYTFNGEVSLNAELKMSEGNEVNFAVPAEDLVKLLAKLPDEEIARRHESFLKEMKWAEQCDMVIENKEGELDATISEVEEAIENMV